MTSRYATPEEQSQIDADRKKNFAAPAAGQQPGNPGYQPQGGQPMGGQPMGMTFSQMQQQGYARPARPHPMQQQGAAPQPGAPQQGGAQGISAVPQGQAPVLQPTQTGGPVPSAPPTGRMGLQNPLTMNPVNQPLPNTPSPTTQDPGGYTGRSPWSSNQLQPLQGVLNRQAPMNSTGDPMLSKMITDRLSAPGYTQQQNPMLDQLMQQYMGSNQSFNPSMDPSLRNAVMSQGQNFQGYSNPVAAQQQSLVQDSLSNPSAYTTDMFKTNLAQANQGLDEQYGLDKKSLDEQMAQRGLHNSTMAVGQLGDLGVQHERSKANLSQNLLTQMAQGYQNDRSSALNSANNFSQQGLNQFNSNQAAYGSALDRGANYDVAQNQLGLSAYGANQAAQGNRLNAGVNYQNQQQNNGLNTFQANEAVNAGRINQATGYDQQVYDRSWQNNLLNNQNDQNMMNVYLRMMGL